MGTVPEGRALLHQLIDALRAEDVSTAQRVLEALNTSGDPLPGALMNVPVDDEQETDDERNAVAEARRELEGGQGIPHDEAMKRLGLA